MATAFLFFAFDFTLECLLGFDPFSAAALLGVAREEILSEWACV